MNDLPLQSDDVLTWATCFTSLGFAVVPIPAGKKAPVIKAWQSLKLTHTQLGEAFTPGCNIGVILGEPSNGLVDVDLDSQDAIDLAEAFLPSTACITGRAGKPRSHFWYIAAGAETKQYRIAHADGTRESIVELRSTGGQTVVGPSIHPDGDTYECWPALPTEVRASDLAEAVHKLFQAVQAKRTAASKPAQQPAQDMAPAVRRYLAASQPHQSASQVERRAAAYLAAMPAAISGAGGHNATYAAAAALVHGFGLSESVAFSMLLRDFNPRCQPEWSPSELQHKVRDATIKPHAQPFGYLLADSRRSTADNSDVDISGITDRMTSSNGVGQSAQAASVAVLEDDAPDEDLAEDDMPRQVVARDPGAFPAHLLKVPGLIGDVVAYNLSTAVRSQPALALAGAICLQSVLAGRKVADERGNRTNVYVVAIAPSGAGKEHARSINSSILSSAKLDHLLGAEDIASDSSIVNALESNPNQLLQIDEFGRLMKSVAAAGKSPHLYAVTSVLLKLYSSAGGVYRGKMYSDASKNKVIQQPCLSIYGTTVAESFWQSLSTETVSDGLLGRLLIIDCGERPRKNKWTPAREVPKAILDACALWSSPALAGSLINTVYPSPRIVATTSEAKQVWEELSDEADDAMQTAGDGISSVWARTEEKACRLALIYACSANPVEPLIDGHAAKWAADFARWATLQMISKADEFVGDNPFDAFQRRVIRFIRRAGGTVSASVLTAGTRWLNVRQRGEVLDNMVMTGELTSWLEKGKKGRGCTFYSIPSG